MIYRVINSQCAMRNAQLFDALGLRYARFAPWVTFARSMEFIRGG